MSRRPRDHEDEDSPLRTPKRQQLSQLSQDESQRLSNFDMPPPARPPSLFSQPRDISQPSLGRSIIPSPIVSRSNNAQQSDSARLNNAQQSNSARSFALSSIPASTIPDVTVQTALVKVPRKLQNQKVKELLDEGIDKVQKKKNLFVTGPAGSGKSYYTGALVTHLRNEGLHEKVYRVQIIAPTGTAALNVGGKTCHSFFGLTPNTVKRGIDALLEVADTVATQQRLRDLDVLVIDEISMVSNEFFQQMDRLMQQARKSEAPFGGVTVVAVGDFAQLAPVQACSHCMICGTERSVLRRGAAFKCERHGEMPQEDKWAFKSPTWSRLQFHPILLPKVLRQTSTDFQDIVYEMWLGNRLSARLIRLLNEERSAPTLIPIHLYPLREPARIHNEREFKKLKGLTGRYVALDRFNQHPSHQHSWIARMGEFSFGSRYLKCLSDHRYPERLELRIGMPVVLLQNIAVGEGLVNGSQGMIVGFTATEPAHMLSRIGSGTDVLGYCWEDSDGKVTEGIIESLGGSYSEVRQEELRQFILDRANRGQRWPVVTFAARKPYTAKTVPIFADCSVQEIRHEGRVSMTMRTQIPLIAGWAMTIHKAQGMSLDSVATDLHGAFDPGQEYVALSRARTLDGLVIRNLKNGPELRTPDEVRQFLCTTFPSLRSQMKDLGRTQPVNVRRRRNGGPPPTSTPTSRRPRPPNGPPNPSATRDSAAPRTPSGTPRPSDGSRSSGQGNRLGRTPTTI